MREHEPKIERKGTPELPPGKLPVAIHRWFNETGEGWAYHPSVDIRKIVYDENVGKLMIFGINRKVGGGYKVPLEKGGWFIATVRPDTTTNFPNAKERAAFYLTATVVPGPEPVDTRIEHIYDQLLELPEVESRGESDHLTITDLEE